MKRMVLVVIALVFFSSGLFAGGDSEAAEGAEQIHLVFWNGTYTSDAEKLMAEKDWYITKAVKRFEEANPGVTIEVIEEPDQHQAHQTFKAAALAKNGPDMVNLWSGAYTLSLKDVLLPLDDLIPPADLVEILGWEGVREGFAESGTIYGYPAVGQELTVLHYNKNLIRDAGLDFENNPPRTTAEFDEALAKIKATGVTPFAYDEGGWPGVLYFIANYWWGQGTGLERLGAYAHGSGRFVDDEGLLAALSYYQSLYVNGYVNTDTLSSADSGARFRRGEIAVFPGGIWDFADITEALGAENYGIIQPPNIGPNSFYPDGQLGGAGQSNVVANYTKYPEMSVKFLSFLDSRDEMLALHAINGKIPIRHDISAKDMGWDKDPLMVKALSWASRTLLWVDNVVETNAMNELAKLAPLVFTGQMTPMAAAESMDRELANSLK